VAQSAPSTFLDAPSKFLFIMRVDGAGVGMKVLLVRFFEH